MAQPTWWQRLFGALWRLLTGGKAPRPRSPALEAPAPRRRAEPAARTLAGARVEYAPRDDGEPDPGEVVWAWVSYEDNPSQGKDRPVLLVARRGARLVGVALTSKRRDRGAQVSVGAGPWDREGRESFARCERLLELDPRAVRREGARLPRERFERVVQALVAQHGA